MLWDHNAYRTKLHMTTQEHTLHNSDLRYGDTTMFFAGFCMFFIFFACFCIFLHVFAWFEIF